MAVRIKPAKVRERGARCQCGGSLRKTLELEPAVFLSASGTTPLLNFTAHDIQVITTNAAKRGSSTLAFKASVVPMVIVQPESEKESGHQQAVNNGGDLQAHGMGFSTASRMEERQREERVIGDLGQPQERVRRRRKPPFIRDRGGKNKTRRRLLFGASEQRQAPDGARRRFRLEPREQPPRRERRLPF